MAGGGTKNQNFMVGYEYDLGNGTTGVWSGKNFVSANDYLAQKAGGKRDFSDNQADLSRLNDAAAMAQAHPSATGFMGGIESGEGAPSWSPFHGIGGTPGYNLNAKIQPVRSNATLNAIKEAKSGSAEGSSPFAKVTNYEAQILQSKDAMLDTRQSQDQFVDEVNAAKTALIRHTPGLHPSNPIDLSTVDPNDVPEGAYWRAPNGTVYQQRKGYAGGQPIGAASAPPPAPPPSRTQKNAALNAMSQSARTATALQNASPAAPPAVPAPAGAAAPTTIDWLGRPISGG
jgi:hypothetical protein